MNFMNLPKKYSGKKSKYYILPIEYEGNMTGKKGASKGSKEIIKASYQLEYYDDMFESEPYEKGIHVLKPVKASEPEEAMENIAKEVKKHKGKFIISLGGDHSVTIGILKGLGKNFSVISFDAHADLFDSWNGSKFNHRCVNKQASHNHDMAIVGLRSLDKDEATQIKENEKIHATYDRLFDVLSKLKNKVYISIDVDVFDPSFIRATGTPEPGGFQWNKMIKYLKMVFDTKEVIGVDIVEYSPDKNSDAESYSLAKLVYKIIAMKEFY